MKQKRNRAAAGLMAVLLCIAAFTGCGDTAQPLESGVTVMTVNGKEISAREYAAYMINVKWGMEEQFEDQGLSLGDWEDPENGPQLLKILHDNTRDSVAQNHVIAGQFEKEGLTLTDELLDLVEQAKQEAVTESGGEEAFQAALKEQGLTEELYEASLRTGAYANGLEEHYFGKGGVLIPSAEELTRFYNETFIQAKHILISSQDEEGNPLEGDELAKQEALAKEVLQKVQDGGDFDELSKEYTADPTQPLFFPEGYIFREGEMVDPFYQGALALKENETSGLVKSEFGWHIIRRMPLDPEQQETYAPSTGRNVITGEDFESLLEGWMKEAEVVVKEDLVKKITFENMYQTVDPSFTPPSLTQENPSSAADGVSSENP